MRVSPARHVSRNFNPRTPVGCDAAERAIGCGLQIFQSTHPSGVRLPLNPPYIPTRTFQSTHPSGVRPSGGRSEMGTRPDFNPRTPVGCDVAPNTYKYAGTQFQSTHPSGVRPAGRNGRPGLRNFNPRTPVGCDYRSRPSSPRPSYFNPRTPVGCDGFWCPVLGPVGISIHAPQWGATILEACLGRGKINFNPRTPVGCDATCRRCPRWHRHFNPRTPVGCDLASIAAFTDSTNFNPRTPVGCDHHAQTFR